MKASTKGVFLSALVYPGLGQLVLGTIATGAVFIILTTAGLLVIIYRLTKRLYDAIDQILPMFVNGSPDIDRLVEIVSRSSYDNWRLEGICLLLVLCCWIVSIVHAVVIGQSIDRRARRNVPIQPNAF